MGTHDTLEDGKIRDQAGEKRCGGRQSLPIISEMFAFQREIECGLEKYTNTFIKRTGKRDHLVPYFFLYGNDTLPEKIA